MQLRWLAILLVALGTPIAINARAEEPIQVFKTATCSCCSAWIEHMKVNGFKVESMNIQSRTLTLKKRSVGLKPEHYSCHTAEIGGYVIEGHVPADDVKRLLSERPDAIGLVVPGMPIGSPGMEAGADREQYNVLLIRKDGRTDVYARHQ